MLGIELPHVIERHDIIGVREPKMRANAMDSSEKNLEHEIGKFV